MKIGISGHPLHTRSLGVTLRQSEDGLQRIDASVLDLRKCGFVPVAGFLQPSGVVHHMSIDAVIDPRTRIFRKFEASQTTPAFQPSALTQGEHCRDPLDRLDALRGTHLDESFLRELRRVFAGPLGCSHLLTLAQLLAPSVSTALAWDALQPRETTRRSPGERTFHRAVEIDGFEISEGLMNIAVQLSDLHFRAAPEIADPMRHFGAQLEVRLEATVDLRNGMALRDFTAGERRRDYEGLEEAQWRDRSRELEFLNGQNIMAGMSKRLLAEFESDEANRPFLDALLMLAPGFIQCLASFSERWPAQAKASPTLLGVCGRANSCYMWRNGGPLHRVMEESREPGGS
jgi:hypothetical protein